MSSAPRKSDTMPLVIVASSWQMENFAEAENVVVMLDRRGGQRRRTSRQVVDERRRADRRRRPDLDEQLRLSGWFMARLHAHEGSPRG